jgi:uncharacterized membrane protein YfcA
MDSVFLLLLIGLFIGTVGTLIGAGGGFILVPILLLIHPEFSPETVTAISMAIVATNSLSGSFAYVRAKKVDYKAGLLFATFTIPGSIIGVYATKYISKELFHFVFGVLLIGLSIYLLLKRAKKQTTEPTISNKKLTKHTLTTKEGKTYTYSYDWRLGAFLSSVVGFISPVLGIGGGIVHVPALSEWLKFPVHIATATSHFILAIMASVSVVVHIIDGNYHSTYILTLVLSIISGVIPGAQLGAYLSKILKGSSIIKALAICLALVGLRILVN